MKKLLIFVVFVTTIMTACSTNSPEKIYSGKIIGTLGCYDEETMSVFYKGYFIETTEKEVFLSFHIDVKDSINVRYGTYAIPTIKIPYKFTVRTLKPSDKEYIHYAQPIEDTFHQPIATSSDKIEQVILTPIK